MLDLRRNNRADARSIAYPVGGFVSITARRGPMGGPRHDFVTGKALLMKPEKLEVARNFMAFGCCDAISRLFHACSKFKKLLYMCMVRELFRKCIQLCIGYKE